MQFAAGDVLLGVVEDKGELQRRDLHGQHRFAAAGWGNPAPDALVIAGLALAHRGELSNVVIKFTFPTPGAMEGVKSRSKTVLKMVDVTFQYPVRQNQ